MNSNNTIVLHGRLCADPELKKTASGISVVTGTVAVKRNYKQADGEIPCDFIPFKVFAQKAEFLARWGIKGTEVIISGEIRMEEWTAKTGEKRSRLCVNVDDTTFVGGRKEAKQAEEPKNEEFETVEEDSDLPF